MTIWLLMALVLSNAFKGLLLSSYVNIRSDLAVKSFKDLVNKPLIKVYHDHSFYTLKEQLNSTSEPIEISLIRNRILQQSNVDLYTKMYIDKQLGTGQAVVICNSYTCPSLEIVSGLQLVYADHYMHSFMCLKIRKSHSHLKQISK